MKKKIIFRLIVGVFVIFLIISLARLIINSQENVLLKSGNNFTGLFPDSIYNNLKFDYGYANQEDTLCSYSYKYEYQILVWKIGKYIDIDLTNVSTSLVRDIPDFYFIPYLSLDISKDFSLKKKTIKYKGSSLNINVEKDTKIYENNSKGIYVLTDRIGLGYPNEQSHIIFDFQNGYKEVNLAIRQCDKQPIIILLYPIKKKELRCNILEKLIKH